MLTKIALQGLVTSLVFGLALSPNQARANQSGYVRHGETFIVYKDGKKVGDWPVETAQIRVPANAAPAPNDTLYFVEDDIAASTSKVRCYALSNAIGFSKSEPISCVRID